MRGDDVLAGQLVAVFDPVTDVGGDLVAIERAQLVAEGDVVGGKG